MLNTHILSGIEHSSHRITTIFRAKKHERSGLAANQQRFIVKLGRMNREHEKRLSIQVRQECAVTVDSWTGLTRKGTPGHRRLAEMFSSKVRMDKSFSGSDARHELFA